MMGGGEQELRQRLERADTQLSNERTYLSWLRTSVQSVALGPIAAQLLPAGIVRVVTLARAVALLLVVTGIFEAAAGTWRYFTMAAQIERGGYRTASTTVFITLGLTVAAAAVAIAVILSLRR